MEKYYKKHKTCLTTQLVWIQIILKLVSGSKNIGQLTVCISLISVVYVSAHASQPCNSFYKTCSGTEDTNQLESIKVQNL